ncbi:MAG: tRNA preQ1(34) S-adenosylmethionine ribosyltransferase-isomerase QueA [Burkholderiaceae bacterium]|nr:tRNA preQ1(34) S-adenosylmethionine ribosyltransferase-isomerase QueA [Burkholderiaceae bacterium]MCD8516617.1 tRNA preQ1(34) S-adenosylmethionine ribosyltransferase-isomerase QueA [Burkholderiaceae bacterium]MCD8564809.1 tRNA preQ1(34) S-adenosylmethionine ribosyltransferase-isomerase QueA [Burkholderiaceae bacterium]
MNKSPIEYSLADFDYHLPSELIAQHPTNRRTDSRLLHVDASGQWHDRRFTDVLDLLKPNDILVFNDTLVIKARLLGTKDTGGKVEALVERILDSNRVLAHVRASKAPKPDTTLIFAKSLHARVIGRRHDLFELEFDTEVLEALDQHGHVPLPPYIEHEDQPEDEQRYQTVYARHPGAVAAPTAGLHFDEAMLDELGKRGIAKAFVTLHVGAGTFQPVRDNDLSRHQMHSEWYTVPAQTVAAIEAAKAAGGRVVAVGTTSVRALESACKANAGQLLAHQDDTQLFIKPGYRWHIVDAMITNFHLPQSTLLMLVSAFIGFQTMKHAYQHAVDQRYRFFSYGDAMFLEKGSSHAV